MHEHHAEADLIGHHAVVSFRGAVQREGLRRGLSGGHVTGALGVLNFSAGTGVEARVRSPVDVTKALLDVASEFPLSFFIFLFLTLLSAFLVIAPSSTSAFRLVLGLITQPE